MMSKEEKFQNEFWLAKFSDKWRLAGIERKKFEDTVVAHLEENGAEVERTPCNVLSWEQAAGVYGGSNLLVTLKEESQVYHCVPIDRKSKKVGVKYLKRLVTEKEKFAEDMEFVIMSPTSFTEQAVIYAKAYDVALLALEG